MRILKYIFIITIIAQAKLLLAQGPDKKVEITADFKPTLIPAPKILASATAPTPDSTKPNMSYKVPSQNLFFTYSAIPMRPVAFEPDTTINFMQKGSAAIGFGNFSSPFAEVWYHTAPAQPNDWWWYGKGSYQSAKGKKFLQKQSDLNIDLGGVRNTFKNETQIKLNFQNFNTNLFGGDSIKPNYNKDTVQRKWLKSGAFLSFKNNAQEGVNIYYNPNIKFYLLSGTKFTETNVKFNAPIHYNGWANLLVGVDFNIDFLSQKKNTNSNVVITQVSPFAQFQKKGFKILAGVRPTLFKGQTKLFPNLELNLATNDKKYDLFLGAEGNYNKNSFGEILDFNPYLSSNYDWRITTQNSYYGGIRFSLGNTIKVEGKGALTQYENLALFYADTNTGRDIDVSYASKVNSPNIKANIQYTLSEKIKINGDMVLQSFTNLEGARRVWGLPWLTMHANAKVQAGKKVFVHADLNSFSGGWNRLKNNQDNKLGSNIFLSLGTEVEIFKNGKIWLNGNNLLGNTTNRWYRYPVLGLQILGGFRYDF